MITWEFQLDNAISSHIFRKCTPFYEIILERMITKVAPTIASYNIRKFISIKALLLRVKVQGLWNCGLFEVHLSRSYPNQLHKLSIRKRNISPFVLEKCGTKTKKSARRKHLRISCFNNGTDLNMLRFMHWSLYRKQTWNLNETT